MFGRTVHVDEPDEDSETGLSSFMLPLGREVLAPREVGLVVPGCLVGVGGSAVMQVRCGGGIGKAKPGVPSKGIPGPPTFRVSDSGGDVKKGSAIGGEGWRERA